MRLPKIKPYKEFLTVDELRKQLHTLVSKEERIKLGESKDGYPIEAARLGKGKKSALIFAFPHPNEAVGGLTCVELIKLIKKDSQLQKQFTWYIVPCADPDGAKLNEGWFKHGFNLRKYILNFYRSKAALQTDWSFPYRYRGATFKSPPKNTRALMALIKKIKPSLVYALHNTGFNGAYFYMTKKMPFSFYKKLNALCNSLHIPLDHGEPEFQFIKRFYGPVFKEFDIKDYFNYYKKLGKNPKRMLDCGTDSIDFAKQYRKNVLGLVGEVPYLYDTRLEDTTKSVLTRRACIEDGLDGVSVIYDFLEMTLQTKGINKTSLFYDLLKTVVAEGREHSEAVREDIKKRSFDRKATIAEEFSAKVVTRFYEGLALGELKRLLEHSYPTREIKRALIKTNRKIAEFIRYLNSHERLRVMPIKKLVQLQLGFLLLSLD